MTLTYILFLVGFALLIKGADLMVDGASSIAHRLGISALAIGLSVVAFGTSLPELIVNILASYGGNKELALGNILGSNIANILLILGITAMIHPLAVSRGTVWKEIPLSLLAVLVLIVMISGPYLDGSSLAILDRADGFILIAFLIIFLYYIFGISKIEGEDKILPEPANHSLSSSVLMISLGLIGLGFGGKWVVEGAVLFAENLGISQAVIGLTIVAFGTSLPELATSIVAALKKQTDIAVGNIVGSNIFNIFWILGASAIIRPLTFSPELFRDVFMVIFATVLLFIFMFVGRKETLERSQAAGFVALYIIYIAYLATTTTS
jgi:cation:H+ antiporter